MSDLPSPALIVAEPLRLYGAPPVVVDCSVLAALLFDEAGRDVAEQALAELRATRERGYSIDDEENEVGARCVGVAVTDATGRPQAAISVSGPAARVYDTTIDEIGASLVFLGPFDGLSTTQIIEKCQN